MGLQPRRRGELGKGVQLGIVWGWGHQSNFRGQLRSGTESPVKVITT